MVQAANLTAAHFFVNSARTLLSLCTYLFSRRKRKKIQDNISFAAQSLHNKGCNLKANSHDAHKLEYEQPNDRRLRPQ